MEADGLLGKSLERRIFVNRGKLKTVQFPLFDAVEGEICTLEAISIVGVVHGAIFFNAIAFLNTLLGTID